MWLKDGSSECSRIGSRIFQDITSITRTDTSPRRPLPCWSTRYATRVSAARSASGEILNEEFFETAEPDGKRARTLPQ